MVLLQSPHGARVCAEGQSLPGLSHMLMLPQQAQLAGGRATYSLSHMFSLALHCNSLNMPRQRCTVSIAYAAAAGSHSARSTHQCQQLAGHRELSPGGGQQLGESEAQILILDQGGTHMR